MNSIPKLVPFSVFVCIVLLIFVPLSRMSDTAILPCMILAKSFCTFYIGCYIAEFLKGKVSRKIIISVSIIGVISLVLIPLIDILAINWIIDPCCILGLPEKYIRCASMNPFFLCLGFILNSSGTELIKYPIRKLGSVRMNIIMAVLSTVSYIILIYLIHVPAFFEGLSNCKVSEIRFIVRVVSLIPWIASMIYLYRVLTSKFAYAIVDTYPKLFRIIANLAPGLVLLLLYAHMDYIPVLHSDSRQSVPSYPD